MLSRGLINALLIVLVAALVQCVLCFTGPSPLLRGTAASKAGDQRAGTLGVSMAAGKGFGATNDKGKKGGGGGAERAEVEVVGGADRGLEPVMYLPLKSVKVGALRMFLSIWTMAREDWKGSQGDDGTLMAATPDGAGGALIEIKDEKQEGGAAVVVWRVEGGTLAYRLKESLLMHALLDELEGIMKDDGLDKSNAIFELREETGIDEVRKGLPARPH